MVSASVKRGALGVSGVPVGVDWVLLARDLREEERGVTLDGSSRALEREAVLATLRLERAEEGASEGADASLGVSGALFVRLEARVGLRVLPLLVAVFDLSDAGILGRAAVVVAVYRQPGAALCTLDMVGTRWWRVAAI